MMLPNFFTRTSVFSRIVRTQRPSIFMQFLGFRGFIVIAPLLLFPGISHAQIVFNEIAWMGTTENFRCEWIELYNSGSAAVDIGEWRLQIGGGQEKVLSPGEPLLLSAGAYLVIERSVPSCPDPVSGVPGLMLAFGDIPNSDTELLLLNPQGEEDRVVSGTDWDGKGDNVTKETAMRTPAGEWTTGVPTPGTQNSGGSSNTAQNNSTSSTSPTISSNTSASSGSSRSNGASVKKTTISYKDVVLELKLIAPATAYVNQPVTFEVVPTGAGKTVLNSLHYHWNFGDLDTAETKAPVHAFAYEGEYVLIVEAEFGTRKAVMRHEITVLPVTLSLTRTDEGDVVIRNTAPYEVDMSGYTMRGQSFFTLPKNTILKAGGSVTVPHSRIGGDGIAALYDGKKEIIASTQGLPAAPRALAYAPAATPMLAAAAVRRTHQETDVSENTVITALTGTPLTASAAEADEEDDTASIIRLDSARPEEDALSLPPRSSKIHVFFASVLVLATAALYIRKGNGQ